MSDTAGFNWKEWIRKNLPLVYLVVGLFALRWTIVEPYVVPTGSMEPTLKTGDRLWALKCAYDVRFPFTNWTLLKTGTVKHGDIILFEAPMKPEITYVKRALGLPGDRVAFKDGVYYLNGKAVTKKTFPSREVMYDIDNSVDKKLFVEDLAGILHYVILDDAIHGRDARRDTMEVTVPPGHVFAVGDNRDNSYDSRYWGLVPMENLKGRAMAIWFSSWNWRIRPERIGTPLQ